MKNTLKLSTLLPLLDKSKGIDIIFEGGEDTPFKKYFIEHTEENFPKITISKKEKKMSFKGSNYKDFLELSPYEDLYVILISTESDVFKIYVVCSL